MRENEIKELAVQIDRADAIFIGAGAGLSVSAGMTYSGHRFEKYFSDFIAKYHFLDMYSGGFYPFPSLEEQWAYWSRYIWINRYQAEQGTVYKDLLNLVKDKDYFVLTTNVDHCFQKADFDKERLFYTQGDYGLWQCSKPCHIKTYDNESIVQRMVNEQKNMLIPSELVPYCPICGSPMAMNLRCDHTFVQDEGWYEANKRYENFIRHQDGRHIVFLEIGVGDNTPVIIKYPFWQMTNKNPNAVYACININDTYVPTEILNRTVYLKGDIGRILSAIKKGGE